MKLPCAIIEDNKILQIVHAPVSLIYGEGDDAVQHPQEAWYFWDDADWKEKCPNWSILPIESAQPEITGTQYFTQNATADWEITNNSVKVTYTVFDKDQDIIDTELKNTKDSAIIDIDNQAEVARLKFLTPGAGQALEYERTLLEARTANDTEGDLDPAKFPWLAAELNAVKSSGNDAYTLRDVVNDVLFQAEQWNVLGAAIKEKRRAAKLKVDAAKTIEEVKEVFPINWFEGMPT